MVRVLAPALLVPVFAEESLMQSQAHDMNAGASKTQRMHQNSQAMEDQYVALLTNIVKSGSWSDPATGNPWVPKKGILDEVLGVITDMEGDLDEQMKLNAGIMGEHTATIKSINTARDTSLAGHVTTAKNAMTTARNTHNSCRSGENGDITDMETKCDSFEKVDKCGTPHEQDWYAAIAEGSGGAGSLREAVDKAVACKASVDKTKATAPDCDGKQDSFQSAWCDYADDLKTTCDKHRRDWQNALDDWKKAEGSIQKLETEQKTIFRMLGRIKCYMTLLFGSNDGSKTPVQADIDNCQKTSIGDSSLDVDYHTTEQTINNEKGDCEDDPLVNDERIENVPGQAGGAWYSKEFGASPFTEHNKINADSTCS